MAGQPPALRQRAATLLRIGQSQGLYLLSQSCDAVRSGDLLGLLQDLRHPVRTGEFNAMIATVDDRPQLAPSLIAWVEHMCDWE
jgi:hypothetical protein